MNSKADILGVLDLKNYDITWDKSYRTAIRGIICSGDKIAFIYSAKYGEYKFPGGGMEVGESKEDTLIREVQEETGLKVIPQYIRYYGRTNEIKRDKGNEAIFEQVSYYYFCEVDPEVGERNLDAYEEEYEYELIWKTLEEALENNLQIKDVENSPWIFRDTMVMKKLKEDLIME